MSYSEPSIFKNYKVKLARIINENPEYWLQRDENNNLVRGFELWVEVVDRHFVFLGPIKQQLLLSRIPTQDTLIRRFRDIVSSGEVYKLLEQLENQKKQKVLC